MPKYDAVEGPATGSTKRVDPKNLVTSRVEIEPSENGGFVAKCFKKESKADRSRSTYCGYYEPEVYTYESYAALVTGLKKILG